MKAFAATRRGRPKSVDSTCDRGTLELQAMRRRIACGGDPNLAENPLSAMLARGLISAEQHAAGCRYERLYRSAVARKEISYDGIYEGLGGGSSRGSGASPTLDDSERKAEIRARYLTAKAGLAQAGLVAARAVEALAVFGEWPDFLVSPSGWTEHANDNLSRAAIRRILQIRAGLDALSAVR